jgi:2,4-dienoyl-CoA reductase-like NADH-dependent reductase (Old Yellow Enzyme family)
MSDQVMARETRRVDALFEPVSIGGLALRNRLAMAPMTRGFSPGAVPGDDVAAYYQRRAEGGVGLIITEGTFIPHPAASNNGNIPNFHGDDALAGWKKAVDLTHAHGAKIVPQLWHVGLLPKREVEGVSLTSGGSYEVSPSGYIMADQQAGEPMSRQEIEAVITAFGVAARSSLDLGFDGIEIHGAHGYLIDQFLWEATNRRIDDYGGGLAARSRFAADVVRECRRQTTPDFPILFRFSQWKQQDYSARLARNPQELETVLSPLVEAGVDIFHCSQRRFWQAEFDGDDTTLSGWTKRVTGKPAITVGSVGLELDMGAAGFAPDAVSGAADLDRLMDVFARGEFDVVAVGRALIGTPDWAELVRRNEWHKATAYSAKFLGTLY